MRVIFWSACCALASQRLSGGKLQQNAAGLSTAKEDVSLAGGLPSSRVTPALVHVRRLCAWREVMVMHGVFVWWQGLG